MPHAVKMGLPQPDYDLEDHDGGHAVKAQSAPVERTQETANADSWSARLAESLQGLRPAGTYKVLRSLSAPMGPVTHLHGARRPGVLLEQLSGSGQ